MHKLYLAVTHSGTWFANGISLFTNGAEYSHAGISFSPTLNPLYSFGRKFTYLLLPSGFITQGFGKHFYNHHPRGKLRVYLVTLTDAQYDLLNARLQPFIDNTNSYKYGTLNIAYHYFGIPIHRSKHYTCIGFVAEMLNGILPFNKDSSLVKPMDMCNFDLPLLYEGSFKNFNSINLLEAEYD